MRTIDKSNIQEVKKLITDSEKICLLGHHNPDGDAVSGCLALSGIMQKIGKTPKVVMPSAIPDYLKFLNGTENIIIDTDNGKEAKKTITEADLIFCIDFNDPSRVKNLEQTLKDSKATKVLLDHHPQPEDFTDFAISKTKSSSASEVVFDFLEIADFQNYLTKDTAAAIYTGMLTDTLNFSIETAGKKTFKVVSQLMEYEFDKNKIHENIYNTYSWNRLQLVGYLLSTRMNIIEKHKIAYIILTESDKEKFNYKLGDIEGVVNMPLSVKEIRASVLFTEKEDEIKASLRSKNDFNVNKFARKYFNGGGHERAAGGRIKISVEELPKYLSDSLDSFE